MNRPTPLPQKEARLLLQRFYIDDPSSIPLEDLAALLDVYVFDGELHGAEARIQVLGDSAIVTIRRDIESAGQRNFAIAHELGHFVLHRASLLVLECTARDFLILYQLSDRESEANAFAAELLMPTALFDKESTGLIPSRENLSFLAERFGVSLTAAAYRFVEVGHHPCALILSTENGISWFAKSRDFYLHVRGSGEAVHEYSCAGDFFINGQTPPAKPVQVGAFCWLKDCSSDDRRILYEQAFAMPRFGQVLSVVFEP